MYTKLPISIEFDGERILTPETELELNGDDQLFAIPLTYSTGTEEILCRDAPLLINYGNTSGELSFRVRHRYADLCDAYCEFIATVRRWRAKGCGTLVIDGMEWEASITACTPSLGYIQSSPALFVEYSFTLGRILSI